MDLRGAAFVIGASGIGEACALGFAKSGTRRLLVADINLEAAQGVATRCKPAATNEAFRADAITLDITSDSSVSKAMTYASRTLGRIDYFVNAAGVGVSLASEVAEANIAEFNNMLSVNVTGTFLTTRAVSAIMKSQEPMAITPEAPGRGTTRGCIVIIGSASAFTTTPRMIQYTTSKHAVLGLTKSAALDNAAHGIRVNSVCPSWVDTPMVRKAMDDVPELARTIENAVPIGRIAMAEEVADAVMFFCSSMSSYATGCNMILDGGTTLSSVT